MHMSTWPTDNKHHTRLHTKRHAEVRLAFATERQAYEAGQNDRAEGCGLPPVEFLQPNRKHLYEQWWRGYQGYQFEPITER